MASRIIVNGLVSTRPRVPQVLGIGNFCKAIGSRRRATPSAKREMKDKAAEAEYFMWKSPCVQGGADPDKLLEQPATHTAQESHRAHSCVLGLPWTERDYSSLGISEASGPSIAIFDDASWSCIFGSGWADTGYITPKREAMFLVG